MYHFLKILKSKYLPRVRYTFQETVSDTKTLWVLALPPVLLNLFRIGNSLLDIKSVGYLSTTALTAVGSTFTITMLMYALAASVAVSASAFISRAYGARDYLEIRNASKEVLSFGIIFGFLITGLIYLFIPAMIHVFSPLREPSAGKYMRDYLEIIALSAPAVMIVQISASSLIAIGKSKSQMYITGFQIVLFTFLNMNLTPEKICVLGKTLTCFNMGVRGTGMAYTLSMWVSATLFYITVSKGCVGYWNILKLPSVSWIKKIFKISSPASINWLMRISMIMLCTKMLRDLDNASVAIAAFRIGFTLESIAIMPAVGIGQAAAALVGNNLGEKNPEKATRIGWLAGIQGSIIAGLISIVLYVYARDVAGMLIEGKMDVADEVATLLRVMCAIEFLQAMGVIFTNILQTAGDTKNPMYLSFTCLWLIRMILMYVSVYILKLGSTGSWMVLSASMGLYALLIVITYAKGSWKKIKLS